MEELLKLKERLNILQNDTNWDAIMIEAGIIPQIEIHADIIRAATRTNRELLKLMPKEGE